VVAAEAAAQAHFTTAADGNLIPSGDLARPEKYFHFDNP